MTGLKIARKQYDHMVDIAAAWVREPTDSAIELALIAYQEEIGWPWRATKEQSDDWNQRSATWDKHVAATLRSDQN